MLEKKKEKKVDFILFTLQHFRMDNRQFVIKESPYVPYIILYNIRCVCVNPGPDAVCDGES